jgi:cathepsin B
MRTVKIVLCVLLLYKGLTYASDFGLGLIPSDIIPKKEEGRFLDDFPSYFNWDEYTSQIRNQGNCGSCVSFAVLASMEAKLRICEDSSSSVVDLSEQDIVSCGPKGHDYGGCEGNTFDRVFEYIKQYGVVDEECFPYVGVEIDCLNRCSNGMVTKIEDWNFLDYAYTHFVRFTDSYGNLYSGRFYIPSVEAIKEAVMRGPITVGMAVFSDFYDYAGGIYESTTFTYDGLHSVVVVGWDDTLGAWICRNSWGEEWGDEGNFTISWITENFYISDYDYTFECDYTLCVCNSSLIGFNAVEFELEFDESSTTTTILTTSTTTTIATTTTSIETTTTTSIEPSTTTTAVETTTTIPLPPPTTSIVISTTTSIPPGLYIKGMVISRINGFVQGLGGVKVDLIGNDMDDYDITNQFGEFEFHNLEVETYVVNVAYDKEFSPSYYFLDLQESVEDLRFYQKSSECVVVLVYGDDSEEAESLRYFRDNTLNQTPEGQEIIKLYYQWSPAIVRAMEEDGEFRDEAKEMIDGILPLIR